ncbi:hypothetical protein HMSSN036_23640 [Paenibacillus macerans]|nr:hypothetical protein HMSSN036_23640 [Paenibacillus macerans]
MEIEPRIAGSMGLNRYLGVNLPLLGVFTALNQEVEIISNSYKIEMDRALINRCNIEINYTHVYIDLDDTIIVNNQVNPIIISFCINV